MVEFSCRDGIQGRCLSEQGLHVADCRAARKGAEKGSKMHVDCSAENWPRTSGGQKRIWVPESRLWGTLQSNWKTREEGCLREK